MFELIKNKRICLLAVEGGGLFMYCSLLVWGTSRVPYDFMRLNKRLYPLPLIY